MAAYFDEPEYVPPKRPKRTLVQRMDESALVACAVIVSAVIGGILLFFCTVVGISAYSESRSCPARYAGSTIKARWTFWGECQVAVDGQWLPESKFKPVMVTVDKLDLDLDITDGRDGE